MLAHDPATSGGLESGYSRADPDIRTKNGKSPLMSACERGYLRIVQMLLQTGRVDANAVDSCGESPIYLAAERGFADIVELLLAHDPASSGGSGSGYSRADPDIPTKYGMSPLIIAAKNGRLRIVEILLQTGRVDVNALTTAVFRPLFWVR